MIAIAKREREKTANSLSEMIALIDRNHCLVKVNKAMAKVLGKSPAETVGQTCYLSSQGLNNKKQAEKDMQALFKTGQPQTGTFYDENLQAQYEASLTTYYDPGDKTVVDGVYIARDITNRKSNS